MSWSTSPVITDERDEVLEIDFKAIKKILQRHVSFLMLVGTIGFLVAGLSTLIAVQDQYSSSAKLLVNSTDSSNLVSDYALKDSFIKGFVSETDPFKNQQELLQSDVLAKRVFKRLKKTHPKLQIKNVAALKKAIHAEHLAESDFIEVVVTWTQPKLAQQIAAVYLATYQDLSAEIMHKPLQDQRHYLEQLVVKTEADLHTLDNSLNTFQEENGVFDLAMQSDLLLREVNDIQTAHQNTEVQLAEKAGQIAALRSQLKMSTSHALDSVANGQNPILAALITQLNLAQQEWDTKALVYAPTNPDMEKLGQKIAVLKQQIEDQQIIMVGNNTARHQPMIMDNVRSELARKMAILESEYTALKARQPVSQKQLNGGKSDLSSLPYKQVTYSQLMFKKKNLEEILGRLKTNLAEVQFKESSVQQPVVVVDPPDLPVQAKSPNRLHLMALACLMGFIVPTGSIVVYQYCTSPYLNPEFLTRSSRLPLLGIIPYQSNVVCLGKKGQKFIKAEPEALEAYYTTAVKLFSHKKKTGQRVVGLSFLQQQDEGPLVSTVVHLSRQLVQNKTSVVLLDINQVSKPLMEKLGVQSLQTETLSDVKPNLAQFNAHLTSTTLHDCVQYCQIDQSQVSLLEFLNSSDFEALLATLRSQFDWVIVLTKPLSKGYEGFLALQAVDTTIIVSDQNNTKQQLTKVLQRFAQMQIGLLGLLFKEQNDLPKKADEEYYYALA